MAFRMEESVRKLHETTRAVGVCRGRHNFLKKEEINKETEFPLAVKEQQNSGENREALTE